MARVTLVLHKEFIIDLDDPDNAQQICETAVDDPEPGEVIQPGSIKAAIEAQLRDDLNEVVDLDLDWTDFEITVSGPVTVPGEPKPENPVDQGFEGGGDDDLEIEDEEEDEDDGIEAEVK